MIFTMEEVPNSRSQSRDSLTLRYTALGELDDAAVANYAIFATAPIYYTPYGTFYRQDVKVDAVGDRLFDVTVPYAPRQRETGSYSFSFDTQGGTVRIKAAKEHIATYDSSGPVGGNFHKGSVGVTPDGDVEGAEIVIPALKLSVTFRHPAGVISMPYVKQLAQATGCVNADYFLTFDPGELLFLGASGSDGTEAEAEATYHLAASQNVTGLAFGDIENIVKEGWEYAWVEFVHAVESGRPAVQPKRVHIERLYEPISFASFFGWS